MFKLFSVDNNNVESEVFSDKGIFVVYELFEYKFIYTGDIIEKTVFIEDEVIDFNFLTFGLNSIKSKEKKRFFENYFGYLKFCVNKVDFSFEVRIQKLKVPELEEILLFLWNQDPILFDNFFSKSTLKSKLNSENENLDYSSKFVNIFEDFYSFFKSKYYVFKTLPHYVLRVNKALKDYESSDISSASIDWLVNNLDELHIDYLYKNVTNSIQINNSYGLIEKILTEEKINDFDVYENQIILGAFEYVNSEICNIRNTIKSFLSNQHFYEKNYYSINEFKIIPFLKLRDDLEKVESKIKSLQRKYETIFVKAKIKNSSPKLTPVFSNKKHYTEAYNKIKLIRNVRINLDGELNLLNIKKLSTLYERFNLFILINSLNFKKPTSFSFLNPKVEENVYQEFQFQFSGLKLTLFYDTQIKDLPNKTGLQRISQGYFKPDYIIKVEAKSSEKYYILDSKYSFESTVKNQHLLKCIKDYILDIGITGSPNLKPEELILIYPGETEEVMFGSNLFKPKISIMPSKVNKINLKNFIDNVIFKDIY